MSTEIGTLAMAQLRTRIAERLRSAILQGEIKPGEWLRQEQLAQKFGVSQTPVREALKDLVAEGLVEHVPYRGVRVVEFTPDDVEDLYACRAFMEGLAARHAAFYITAEELNELEQVLDQIKQRMALEHLSEYRRLNRMFHQLVYTASRRTHLIRMLNQMWTAFPTMMLSNFAQTVADSLPEREAPDIEEHQAILDTLKARDADEAERRVSYHIKTTASQIVAVLRKEATDSASGPAAS